MSSNVLIADRDLQLAELYCRFLADHGISAAATASGHDCCRRVRQQTPRVLVLDCELPWDDTRGILGSLREDGLSLPVILTIWDTVPRPMQPLVVPPAVLCLRKFFPLPALLNAVHLSLNCDGAWFDRMDHSPV